MQDLTRRRTAGAAALMAALMAAGVAATWAQNASAAPSVPARAEAYTFAFHDADISQVAEAILGDALGLSFTVDPAVTGKMSFRIDRKLTGAQLLEAFEVALESSDIAIVREGDSLVLKPRAKAKGVANLRSLNDGVHGAGYETVAAPLDYAAPTEVAKALQAVTTEDPVVYADDKQGLLILGGTASELEAAVNVIRLLDHSGLEDSKIRFFDLQEAPAQTVADDLDQIMEAAHATGITVVPLKRLNGLFVFARTSQALEEVGRWITKLDIPSRDKSASLFVYHPKNLSAEALGSSLGAGSGSNSSSGPASSGSGFSIQPMGSQSQSSTTSPSLQIQSTPQMQQPATAAVGGSGGAGQAASFLSVEGEPVRVAVDKNSNTLMFSASPSRWVKIQRILAEIDRPPGQVLIEATILEVTLTNQFNFGVDWSLLTDGGRLGVKAVTNAAGAVAASYPGFSVTFLDKNISAAVNALGGKTAVEVVSAPKVVALDNHVATLSVGDQVPVVTQSSQNTTSAGAPIVSNIDYRDTGVILEVTPRISGDNRIFLDISQEVSSVAQTTTAGISSPTIQQRKLATTLVLDSGAVVALGGMISSSKSKSDTGIPYLQDIPGVGSIFKSSTKSGNRTELIVLLTAKIITDQASADQALKALLADMSELKSHGLLAR